jgi:hypothetical protein
MVLGGNECARAGRLVMRGGHGSVRWGSFFCLDRVMDIPYVKVCRDSGSRSPSPPLRVGESVSTRSEQARPAVGQAGMTNHFPPTLTLDNGDIELVCRDCQEIFLFDTGEQEFFKSRGFENKPSRCKQCRDKRKGIVRNKRDTQGWNRDICYTFQRTGSCDKASSCRFSHEPQAHSMASGTELDERRELRLKAPWCHPPLWGPENVSDSGYDSDNSSVENAIQDASGVSTKRKKSSAEKKRKKKEKKKRKKIKKKEKKKRKKLKKRERKRRRQENLDTGASSSSTSSTSSTSSSDSSSSYEVNAAPAKDYFSSSRTAVATSTSAEVPSSIVKGDLDDDDDFGPTPLNVGVAGVGRVDYGKALLSGEGEAMAEYVQKDIRIPRRGEVGWTSNEIDSFENLGYAMSGNRHARMTAVRLRKESQVLTAEDKRAIALLAHEEKKKKETEMLGEFRAMVQEKIQGMANQKKK